MKKFRAYNNRILTTNPSLHFGKNTFITEDKEGNVWVGTDKGLKRIETNGDQIRVEGNYEKENGLEEAGLLIVHKNRLTNNFKNLLKST